MKNILDFIYSRIGQQETYLCEISNIKRNELKEREVWKDAGLPEEYSYDDAKAETGV